VSREEELKSNDVPNEKPILVQVLAKGITSATKYTGFDVTVLKLLCSDLGDRLAAMVSVDFTMSIKNNE
jgi:ABC-type amino acid transport substrate-binding protein